MADEMGTGRTRAPGPGATLPGPSRTITVEPITAPREEPARRTDPPPAPVPSPKEPEREPEPQPA